MRRPTELAISVIGLCRAEQNAGYPARRTGGTDAFQSFVVKVGLLHLESASRVDAAGHALTNGLLDVARVGGADCLKM